MVESFWIKEVNDLVMELKRMKKALVVVVILLFLGVGFQPATANEISTNPIFDVDEDCFECQPVSRVDLLKVKLLLIRLKSFTNVISSKYGYIPEVAEKCEEISDRITGTSLQDNPPICYLLLIALISMFPLVGIMELILYPLFSRLRQPAGGEYTFSKEVLKSFASDPIIISAMMDNKGYKVEGAWSVNVIKNKFSIAHVSVPFRKVHKPFDPDKRFKEAIVEILELMRDG